jgi:hypothetical protein
MIFDPEVETLPWAEQQTIDEDAYRRQIAYLFGRSAFYRRKLQEAGFRGPGDVGGLDAVSALPFTEKDELRASVSDADPIGAHLAAPIGTLHDRRAELHSAHRSRPRDLDPHLLAKLCRVRSPSRRPPHLHL